MNTKTRNTYGTTIEAEFVAQVKAADADDTSWDYFEWRVTLTRDGLAGAGTGGTVKRVLPYRMGLGHVQTKCGKPIPHSRYNTLPCDHTRCYMAGPQPAPPDLYSVLCSLKADITDGETFEDWCAGIGYDTDSRKAMETYLACQQSEVESRRFFGRDWPLIVADEDYT